MTSSKPASLGLANEVSDALLKAGVSRDEALAAVKNLFASLKQSALGLTVTEHGGVRNTSKIREDLEWRDASALTMEPVLWVIATLYEADEKTRGELAQIAGKLKKTKLKGHMQDRKRDNIFELVATLWEKKFGESESTKTAAVGTESEIRGMLDDLETISHVGAWDMKNFPEAYMGRLIKAVRRCLETARGEQLLRTNMPTIAQKLIFSLKSATHRESPELAKLISQLSNTTHEKGVGPGEWRKTVPALGEAAKEVNPKEQNGGEDNTTMIRVVDLESQNVTGAGAHTPTEVVAMLNDTDSKSNMRLGTSSERNEESSRECDESVTEGSQTCEAPAKSDGVDRIDYRVTEKKMAMNAEHQDGTQICRPSAAGKQTERQRRGVVKGTTSRWGPIRKRRRTRGVMEKTETKIRARRGGSKVEGSGEAAKAPGGRDIAETDQILGHQWNTLSDDESDGTDGGDESEGESEARGSDGIGLGLLDNGAAHASENSRLRRQIDSGGEPSGALDVEPKVADLEAEHVAGHVADPEAGPEAEPEDRAVGVAKLLDPAWHRLEHEPPPSDRSAKQE